VHKSKAPGNPPTPPECAEAPTEEQIATRARAIYEAGGCQPGHDLDNWLRAESELLQTGDRRLVGQTAAAAA
jgi:hypothetical protein